MGPVIWQNPINWNHPLNRGLVGYWRVTPANNGGSTVVDLVGKNHGTWSIGADAISTKWKGTSRPGGFGEWVFDGTDDYMTVPDDDAFDFGTSTLFSIFCWVNVTSTVTQRFVDKIQQGTPKIQGFALSYNDAVNGVRMTITNGLTYSAWDGATNIRLAGWVQAGMVFVNRQTTPNAADAQIYVNGKPDVTTLGVSNSPSNADLSNSLSVGLGAGNISGAWQHFYEGVLDDIRIYNRALSAAEVNQLYRLSQLRYSPLLNMVSRRVGIAPAADTFHKNQLSRDIAVERAAFY